MSEIKLKLDIYRPQKNMMPAPSMDVEDKYLDEFFDSIALYPCYQDMDIDFADFESSRPAVMKK